MRTYGADVTPSPSMTTDVGRLINAEHPGTTGSLGCAISEAVEAAVKTPGYRYVSAPFSTRYSSISPSSDSRRAPRSRSSA